MINLKKCVQFSYEIFILQTIKNFLCLSIDRWVYSYSENNLGEYYRFNSFN